MIIHVGNISMQRFLPEHTDALYHLVNSPVVRKGMSNNKIIPYESHLLWVKENLLENEKVHLFVTMQADKCQGIVLIKNITGHSAELGIMVNDIMASRKTQLTSKLVTGILYYAFHILNFSHLTMCILPENKNSLDTARKIGAVFQSQDDTYQHFLLEKTNYGTIPLNNSLLVRYQPWCVSMATFIATPVMIV